MSDAHAAVMAQGNVELVHSVEGVLGHGVNLLVDTQQACTNILRPIADKRLVASDPDVTIVAEVQTVCPYLLENPRRKDRSVCLALEKHLDGFE